MSPLKVFAAIVIFGIGTYTAAVAVMLAILAATRWWRRPHQLHNRREDR